MDRAQIERFRAGLADVPSGPLALAISGGPDSLALLLLARAARTGEVVAATVDHGLRREARGEAEMVARVCARLHVAHDILTTVVADDPAGPQAAARAARYAALGRWAATQGAATLATAHHCDDQAETVLMRLARGSGLAGLSGIRRLRPIEGTELMLARPLLDWTKAELEKIVADAGVAPARDPSNRDPRFDRTRARAFLAGGWPPPQRVAASAARLAEAEEALAWAAGHLADERIVADGASARIEARGLPREHRRRLLAAAFARLGRHPRGDSLDIALTALDGGAATTLAGYRCDPGPPWRLVAEGPRRSG